MERLIFHVDVNSAFLSWEAARRVKEGLPDLREIPSCIGGDPKSRRGIVVGKIHSCEKIRSYHRGTRIYGTSKMSGTGMCPGGFCAV